MHLVNQLSLKQMVPIGKIMIALISSGLTKFTLLILEVYFDKSNLIFK